jgi:hypothetical protein
VTVFRAPINFDRLLKLRLIVARFGEMDLAKWWNTRGQLGRLGTAAVRRGFPRTHYFAQARSVCAVAAHRCRDVFDPPDCVTLWRLSEAIEEEFEVKWEHWLDHAKEWEPFFRGLEDLQEKDLKIALRAFDAVTDHELDMASPCAGRRAETLCPYRHPSWEATRTLPFWLLDLRGEKWGRGWFLTPAEAGYEYISPFPCRFIIHSH